MWLLRLIYATLYDFMKSDMRLYEFIWITCCFMWNYGNLYFYVNACELMWIYVYVCEFVRTLVTCSLLCVNLCTCLCEFMWFPMLPYVNLCEFYVKLCKHVIVYVNFSEFIRILCAFYVSLCEFICIYVNWCWFMLIYVNSMWMYVNLC